jgi:hypothetical protein
MKYSLLLGSAMLLAAAPQVSATSAIMIKANAGRPEAERFGCSSCHQVTPTKFHKYRPAELTDLGQTWIPKKKKSWWQRLIGGD